MSTKPWPTTNYKIAQLFLDDNNVRLDLAGTSASQDALIHDLFVNQDAYSVAESIAKNGLFIHELPIVTIEGSKTVVLEGNRRIAALKALQQPALVPSYSQKLEALRKASPFLPILDIDTKVAPDRKSALPVLAAIHTSQNRKSWATLRQAYFYYAQIKSKSTTLPKLIASYPTVDVPRFVKMWEMHGIASRLDFDTNEDAIKVQDQQNFPISTLERLYESDSFQKHLKIQFKANGQVQLQGKEQEFKSAFKQVLQDIVRGVVTSRTINSLPQLNSYVATLPAVSIKSGKAVGAAAIKTSKKSPRAKIDRFLAPKDLKCTLPYPAIRRVLHELQQLEFNKTPNAGHDLLRSFLECSFKAYFAHIGQTIPAAGKFVTLADVLSFAEKHFESLKAVNPKVRPLIQAVKIIRQSAGNTTNNYLFSDDFLNALNHSHAVFSTGPQVRAAWDQMEPIFRYILDPK